MSLVRRFGLLILIVSLLVGSSAGIASAQDDVFLPRLTSPTSSDGDFNVEYTVPQEYKEAALAAASSYAALDAVPPLPWYEEEAPAATDPPAELGEFGWSPSGMPHPDADRVAREQYPEAWDFLEQQELDEALAALEAAGMDMVSPAEDYTGSTHTSIKTNAYGKMWNAYPYRAVGKLYIYDGGVYTGYCSASVLPNNLIVTAAHCTYSQSTGFHDAWVFYPAYRNGPEPLFGGWVANNAIVRGPWATGGGRNYDVSLLSLDYKWINGWWRPVSYYTGWLGRVWNYGYQQSLFAMGYPSNLTDGTIYSYTCAAESYYGGATDYITMGCNMTYGSSGGPWIYKFHPYRGWSYNYVDSVVSGGTPGTNYFTGPRFSDDNIGSLCSSWDCGVSYPRP